jgi:hypothetical protein
MSSDIRKAQRQLAPQRLDVFSKQEGKRVWPADLIAVRESVNHNVRALGRGLQRGDVWNAGIAHGPGLNIDWLEGVLVGSGHGVVLARASSSLSKSISTP